MMLRKRIVPILILTMTAAACGGGSASPTAPSSPATTTTTAVTTTPAAPTAPATPATPAAPAAPVSLSGTWLNNGAPHLTLTQNGSTLTGTLVPVTLDLLGMVGTFNGTISGSVSGSNVTLSSQITMVVRFGSDSLTCRGADGWVGTISGSTLTGTFTPQTTQYVCDGGIPLPLPAFPSGPMIFTKQ